MKRKIFLCCIIFIRFISIPAFSQDAIPVSGGGAVKPEQTRAIKFSAGIGPELFSGYTQYQIGGIFERPDGSMGTLWFPISELKFPMEVYMASADLKLGINKKYIVHISIKKNFTKNAGKMKDSDWGALTYDPDSLDIFSKSDAKLNAFIIGGDGQIKIFAFSFFSVNLGAGFLYQSFKYDISNVNQTSVDPRYTGYVSGKVLTYKVDYYIPYAEIMPCFNFNNKVNIMLNMAGFPHIIAKDVDDHLLRYKKSKGKSTGTALMPSLNAEYIFTPAVFLSLSLDYVYIRAKGHQKQYQYKEIEYYDSYYNEDVTIPVGPIGKIENKIESKQFSAGLSAGMVF